MSFLPFGLGLAYILMQPSIRCCVLKNWMAVQEKADASNKVQGLLSSELPADYTLKGNLLPAGTVIQGIPAVRMRQFEIELAPAASPNVGDKAALGPSSEQLSYRSAEGMRTLCF